MAEPRFLTLPEVSEILNITLSQTRQLVKSGELQGIQIGGRNQWRVEKIKLEEYISEAYAKTQQSIAKERQNA
ncbi:helix-turn-helix domain-containing protein [Rothia terrae]|uniref:Helix-turn-helix domain-containing protein n=1 Tax=Rothia terrae TaxID=396015 RepID=A0A7H2BFP7_9MICC|nr:helix-turn-helix domain-containing protein [Rothia terrae]MDT0189125.1 helix-turn-helix domain-containing protein [Rothia terrae]NKZ33310.1 helix-turn-helix domain-containing protein [Rothia terrae]QNV38493.1 helix-turn-helix domain-containing protein [Rothia terrae]